MTTFNVPVKQLAGSFRPVSIEGQFLRRIDFLEMDVMDISFAYNVPNEDASISQSEWTREHLCSDRIARYSDKRTGISAYIARIVGREKETGLSVTLSVRTSCHLVIAFPSTIKKVCVRNVISMLKRAMKSEEPKQTSYTPKLPKWKEGRPWTTDERSSQAKKLRAEKQIKLDKLVDELILPCVIEYHHRAYGFFPDVEADVPTLEKFPFALIFVENRQARDMVASAIFNCGQTVNNPLFGWRLAEVDATPSLQFMEATGIRPSCSMKINLHNVIFVDRYLFTTDIELRVGFDPLKFRARHHRDDHSGKITVVPCETVRPISLGTDTTSIPRKRLAVFDLECITAKIGGFPSADRSEDAIVCISVLINENSPVRETGLTFVLPGVAKLGPKVTSLEQAHETDFSIVHCEDEVDLLCRFRDALVVDFDVDLVTGWNTSGFDWSYISGRMNSLNVGEGTSRCTYLSREIRTSCKMAETTTSSQAHGTRKSVQPDTPLVIQFDMMSVIAKRFKFEQYSLNFVSGELLSASKIDMPAAQMFANWLSGDEVKRHSVAVYCAKDTVLPMRIWQKLLLDSQTTALARVCTILYREVLTRGELWKAYSLMFVFAHERGYILNEDPSWTKYPTWTLKQKADEEQSGWIAETKIRVKQIEASLSESRKNLTMAKGGPEYITQQHDDLRKELAVELKRATLTVKFASKGESRGECNARHEFFRLRNISGATTNEEEEEEFDEFSEKRYEGAKVLPPVTGLYKHVATCDFESLYPNIIKDCNICPSTLVENVDHQDLTGWTYKVIPLAPTINAHFQQSIRGILPMICEKLILERKRAKKEKAVALALGDYNLADVKDGEQNALKIVCNSQYGSIGAARSSGKYTNVTCARSVTGRGRQMLEQTRDQVHSRNPDLLVVYGDTDSVMISYDRFRPEITDLIEREKTIFEHGSSLALSLTKYFGDPINLQFEKVFRGFLLVSKKRYFGMKMDFQGSALKMDAKGVSSVRRSNNRFHRNLFVNLQNLLMEIDSVDHDNLYELVRSELQRALDNKVSIDEFTRSCQLKANYSAPQAQSCVRDKIAKRMPGSEPRVGDRVVYAMARPRIAGIPAYDMAECPTFMKDHNIPLAMHYYVGTIRTSIEQLFEVANLDINRIRRLFDQAEAIALRQLTGQTALSKSDNLLVDDANSKTKSVSERKTERASSKRKVNVQSEKITEFFVPTKSVKGKEFFKALTKKRKAIEKTNLAHASLFSSKCT